MNETAPMSLDRLRTLLDAYGADPNRWPLDERNAALALLAQSPEAQRWRAASARLDALLDLAPAPQASPMLFDRILAAPPGSAPPTIRNSPPYRQLTRRMPRWRPLAAAAGPLAAAAVLVLWTLTRTEREPQRATVSLAKLEAYQLPTDALLELPIERVLDSIPTFGCSSDGLGCVDVNRNDQP